MKLRTVALPILFLCVLSGKTWAQSEAKPDLEAAKAAEAAKRLEEEKIIDLPEKDVKEQVDRLVERARSKKKGDFPALANERRRRSMRELGRFPHPYTLKVLKKQVKDSKLDSFVRQAAFEACGDMKFERKAVARYLIPLIKKNWKDEEVLVGIANALGELGEPQQRDKLYEYFKHKDDVVYVSMITSLGSMKDVQSLPKLYEIFAQYGKKSTQGVSVTVDTGTAGSADQRAAESRGRSMMRKASVDRRDGALDAVKNSVFKITGKEFEFADEFHDWLKENHRKLGLKDLKIRK